MCLAKVTTLLSATLLSCAAAPEEPSIRSYFYVGGQYVDNGSGEHVFSDQMYVERLLPADGITQDAPVVLIHGQAQTGTNFLIKPDGGRGWASDFLRQGYEVYIVDQPARGRSASHPNPSAPSPIRSFSAERIQQRFTATKNYGLWPEAVNHTQWPGAGVMGDEVFDAFYSSNVQFIDDVVYQQTAVQKAGAALLDRIGKPAILIGHSQGGVMPTLIADAHPIFTKALVLLEPQGPPFRNAVFDTSPTRPWGLADIPLQYDPPVRDPKELVQHVYPALGIDLVDCVLQAETPSPRKLLNLLDVPILLLTGEASYHRSYDHCTVRYLRQAGCHRTEHIELGALGMHGNGHMFFLEKNSHDISSVVIQWIATGLMATSN